ncbi:hypothetical protein ACXR0M_10020 [Pseudomonas sp. Eth.TT006]
MSELNRTYCKPVINLHGQYVSVKPQKISVEQVNKPVHESASAFFIVDDNAG